MSVQFAGAEKNTILEKLGTWLQTKPELKLGEFKCEWLPGDMGNRYYGRLFFRGRTDPLILMVMNQPEAFKSEEGGGSSKETFKLTELPFVTVDREFEKAGIRVPHIVGIAEDSEFMLIEDFGDQLLYEVRAEDPAIGWYELALKELAKIQTLKPFPLAASRGFTKDLLMWEAEHFLEFALIKRNKGLAASALLDFRNFFIKMVDVIAAAETVVTHRDYHSKNLIVLEQEKKIGLIDFQDALMGPRTYDLASLLRDSYVTLGDQEEKHLLEYFEKTSGVKIDHALFDLTSLQRNFKAAGRFYYAAMVKNKDGYLPYVAPTLKRIMKTLRSLKELRLLALVEGHLQEEIQGSLKI